MEAGKVIGKVLLSDLLIIYTKFDHKIEHSNFSGRGLLQSTRCIAANTLSNELNVLLIVQVIAPVVRRIIHFNRELATSPNIGNCHFVHC